MDVTVSGRSMLRDICACEAMGFLRAAMRRSLARRRFSSAYLSPVNPPNPCILARTGCTDGLARTRAAHSNSCCARKGIARVACSKKGLIKLECGDAILFGGSKISKYWNRGNHFKGSKSPAKWPLNHHHQQQLTSKRDLGTQYLSSSLFPRKVRGLDGLGSSGEKAHRRKVQVWVA